MENKLLVVGVLAAIPIVPVLILGVLILATQEGRAAPAAITDLIATDASYAHHGQIDLAWNPSDAEDFAYYAIYVNEIEITDITELFPIDQINDRADTSYQVTRYDISGLMLALVEDTEYWFAVTAVDAAGNESEVGTSVGAVIQKMPPIPTVFIKSIYGTGFQPAIITVPIGTTIGWSDLYAANRNRFPHTVTSDTGLFHDELRGSPDMVTHTFTETGVFGYHCEFHISETGTIVVE